MREKLLTNLKLPAVDYPVKLYKYKTPPESFAILV